MPLRRSCLLCETKGPHCFCSLDKTALHRLDHLGQWLKFAPRDRILREGFFPDYVYVICRGTVKLTTSAADGRLLLLRIVGPGDVLGLAAALQRTRYEAAAETLEECELKAIPRTHFLLFMEEFQAVGRNSMMAVARDYGRAVLSARRLAISSSASAKLAAVLADWADLVVAGAHEEVTFAPVSQVVHLRMPLTHEELGHMAGISRETVTRVLGSFRREGLIQMDGEQMTIANLPVLRERAC